MVIGRALPLVRAARRSACACATWTATSASCAASVFDKVRLTRSSGVICVELMKKVQDHGYRIAEVPVHHFHRSYGKSQFFNFPRVARTLLDLASCGSSSWCSKEHLSAGQGPGSRPGAHVSEEPRDFYRGRKVLVTGGLGFIGSNLCRTLADLGARGHRGRQPAPRLRGQPLQPRGLRGQGPHQHRRRARPRHGVPGARPGRALQPGRPGQPHRLHDRSLHRSRDQLHEPALDPGGGAQGATPSSRSSTRAPARSTASRSTCPWTRSTRCTPPT